MQSTHAQASVALVMFIAGLTLSAPAVALDIAQVEIEGGASAVVQRINSAGAADAGAGTTSLGYRADIGATIPLPSKGLAKSRLIAQVRLGQGEGPSTQETYTGAVNSLAFDTSQSGNNAAAILAQLFYQLEYGEQTGSRLSLSIGKLDPFGFFDQNAVADDESLAFLNNVFLHNPMLDSGGDIGGDDFGFAPGIVGSWARHDDAGPRIGVDAGIFGAGDGADFSGSPTRPVSLLQLSFSTRDSQRQVSGTWRLYGWYNPQAGDEGQPDRAHAGWGLSIDQHLSSGITAFARIGKRTRGVARFDSAVTVGAAFSGAAWSRNTDTLGIALGRLNTSDNTSNNASGNSPASTDEDNLEVFYRLPVSESVAITPHWQLIKNPAGNSEVGDIRVLGIRASISF